ncbi:RNA-binding protein 33 [Saguinus oedipus]|uniref:RNA-binding protein 33 n=1 Tax=Saguinus oedipus TaxID=9490 RepID=A0ABQ9UJL6_SAGOE|nr:RNA-binding protein 33 [Saguinus oedipus]
MWRNDLFGKSGRKDFTSICGHFTFVSWDLWPCFPPDHPEQNPLEPEETVPSSSLGCVEIGFSPEDNQSDLSDEELNDDLLQSDNEDEENFSSQGVTISLNATSGMVTSFELSDNTNDQSGEQESEYEQEQGEDELVYHKSDGSELYTQEYTEEGQYEGHEAELTEDQIEYVEEPEEEQLYTDEVLDIEINEPLDEFTVSLFSFVWPKITWLPMHRLLG